MLGDLCVYVYVCVCVCSLILNGYFSYTHMGEEKRGEDGRGHVALESLIPVQYFYSVVTNWMSIQDIKEILTLLLFCVCLYC